MSPVAVAQEYITTAREARDAVKEALENASDLDIGYIGVDDEKRLPQYPAVVVSASGRTKELHGTHTFAVTLRVLLWVYHAKLDVGHRQRSDEDLKLVEGIEDVLESDMTFGDRFIFAYVEDQQPGTLQPRSAKGDLVVGTRMTWVAASQKRF